MKTSALAASLAIVLLLAGCAATTTVTWSKVNVSAAQGRQDLEACAKEADYFTREVGGQFETGAVLGRSDKAAAFEKCMAGKGYKKN